MFKKLTEKDYIYNFQCQKTLLLLQKCQQKQADMCSESMFDTRD